MNTDIEVEIHGVHIKILPMVGINFSREGYEMFSESSLGDLRAKVVHPRTSRKMIEMYNKPQKDLLEIIDHALILLND